MNLWNRREFVGSLGAALLTARARGAEPAPVRSWVTAPSRLHEQTEAPLVWSPWKEASAEGIDLDPGQRYQDLLGFGGAFTDASCWLLSRMTPAARQAVLRDLYGADGLGLSLGRVSVGSSDYSRNAYSYDDASEPDPDLKHFSLEHDRAYILPVLREAVATCPGLYLLGSPWSPPGWMKDNKSLLGGAMLDTYFGAYAQYFARFVQGYAAEGVQIRAVTIQNESDTHQDGSMPQAIWGQQFEMGFVSDHLGPTFERLALDVKIWIIDHNYNLWGRALDELSDANVYKYVDGIAWHGYVGSPDAMTRVHEAFPEKHAYWTEGGPDVTNPRYATEWTRWSAQFSDILRNWARCILCWNLLLDEKGQPDIGPFQCGGLVTINGATKELTYSGQYRAFAHFAKHMRRGARIFASTGQVAGVAHVAAENLDGSRVLVLTNQQQVPRQIQCRLGRNALDLVLPADSITTFVW